MSRPSLRIQRRAADRLAAGHVWVYASDVDRPENARPGDTVTVLDFGSVFDLGPEVRDLYRRVAVLACNPIDDEFESVIGELLRVKDPVLRSAMAGVQHAVFGGLVRGDRIDRTHVRVITERIGELKRKFPGRKAAPPFFMPFTMRTLLAANALLAALEAPELGVYELGEVQA